MGYMEYDWYHDWCDEDYEGYRANPESYTPGMIAYDWLRWQVSPEMPLNELMESSELLDEIFLSIDQYRIDEFTLPVFKLTIIFDNELVGLVREFCYLVKNYLQESIIELIYRYCQYRRPEKYL
jgi:hypothetical protein